MGHGTHTDSRILYGDWSSIEITNPVSGFAPAGGRVRIKPFILQ